MKKKRKLSPATFINSKVTATISIALVLFLLGLIILLSLFAGNFSNYVKETLSFDIVLQDNVSSQQIQQMKKTLERAPFTKSAEYIPKEEAIKQVASELGQNPEEFIGFNPLPDILVVHLNSRYANVDSLKVMETHLKDFSNDIKETQYRKEILEVVNENIARAGFILLIIAVILLIISFALINNTIRLMVYSKRFIIHTMKLVGAKRGFIQKPFILSNLLLGVIAAVIANGLLYWLIYYVSNEVLETALFFDTNTILIVFGAVFVLGIFISFFATFFAVNKYVGTDVDDLYKM
ncbi:cell division protein FtsX [Bacteroidia bacterium]|nr:cell division protein FtsX [Bacteroidia bacterium]